MKVLVRILATLVDRNISLENPNLILFEPKVVHERVFLVGPMQVPVELKVVPERVVLVG